MFRNEICHCRDRSTGIEDDRVVRLDRHFPVHIRRHVIVGSTSVILPGVDLKEGSAFGSFSFINHDPEPWSMNAGIPARKIKDRSRNLLELEKQFAALHKSKSPAEPVA